MSDFDITQTIVKQSGHGPYFWVVVYQQANSQPSTVVFSFYTDARDYAAAIRANGHKVLSIDLASDFVRRPDHDKVQ
jgi:hypothetical protein